MTTAVLPSCPFSSTCVTPGILRRTHPEGEPCMYTQTQSNSAPSCWKTKFCRTSFLRCCKNAPSSMRRCRVIMPITQGLPQRNESFECSKTDGRRRYGPCPVRGVQPDRGALEHEHEVARQSVRGVSRILNKMRYPSDTF